MTDPEINNWPDYILKRLMDDVADVKSDVSNLRTDVKSSLSGIEAHVAAMVEAVKIDRERTDQEIEKLRHRVDEQECNLANIKSDVRVLAGKWAAAISIVVFILQVLVQHLTGKHP